MNQEWQKLSAYAHTRLRTEVHFGSRDPHQQLVPEYHDDGIKIVDTVWVPAVFTAFRELLDNALDEVVLHGHGSRIDVNFDEATMTFSVADNGRGIPIEWSDEHQKFAATVLLSEMNSGRNFVVERGESRGLNGIGAKGVNFCSAWFKAEIVRNKHQFEQTFHETQDASGNELLEISEPMILPTNTKKTGTKITCKLSSKVFPDLRLPERFVAARMQELLLCYPKLHLTFNGKRVMPKPILANAVTFTIEEPDFNAQFYLVPEFTTENEFAFSLVNAIPLFNGGVHLDAFRKGFHIGLLTALERESKRRKLLPNRADISDGLLIYSVLKMTAPSFDSQSKTRLINEHVGSRIRKLLDDSEFFKGIVKTNPFWIDGIYARCAERTKAKDTRETAKQAKKNLRHKIEDLEDACALDRSNCVLFLAEGNSAIAGIVEARDPELHGGLPLRGKVLNVHGRSHKEILANEALAKIMNSVGLIPGVRANRHSLRYGKIFLTCDADPDGSNITALLVNFFYTCWPELFDPTKPAFIYVFDTPLIIAVKGKVRKYWYSNNYKDFDTDKYKGWEVTRAKGLAALQRDDWRYVLQNPKVVPITGDLRDTLDLLFDSTLASARRDWMGI